MLGLGLSDSPEFAGAAVIPTQDSAGRFTAPAPELLAPYFSQLEIVELLGQGGMGTVYKARQTMLDRTVALKILPPEVGRDPAFAERFTREAQALAKLTHPNIVMVFDFGETNGYYYFVMEYVDGINLRQSLQLGRVSPTEALAIVPQICDALQYAHDEGIVHRDIKPENVLLDRRGRVKIADFGLAKLVGTPQSGLALTGTQQVMGTPHYMAPEQLERPTTVDHRADIYSLGVVFYELLTGELPLGRFAPPSRKAAVTADLDQVVLRTLEKEPAQRYQQASELKTAVETLPAEPTAQEPRLPPVIDTPKARVPFSIGDVYGGLAKAEGILRFDGQQLTFEFRVKDEFVGVVSSGIKNISVPVSDILAVDLRSGWFNYTLELVTDQLATLHDIPRAESTRARLQIAKRDVPAASQLVHEVNRALGRPTYGNAASVHPAVGGAAPWSPPDAWRSWNDVDLPQVKREIRAPANGLLLLGILNCLAPFLLVFVLLIPLWSDERQASPPQQAARTHVLEIPAVEFRIKGNEHFFDEGATTPRSIVVQQTAADSFEVHESALPNLPWVFIALMAMLATMLPQAIVMILAAVRIKQLESYGLGVFAAVAAILPFHPLFLFGIPIGIWTLVVLGRRRTKIAFRQKGKLADRQLQDEKAPGQKEINPAGKPVESYNGDVPAFAVRPSA